MPRPDRFPMLDGPSIDWTAAEEAHADHRHLYGCRDSLEAIAAKGGFTWAGVARMRAMVAKAKGQAVYVA